MSDTDFDRLAALLDAAPRAPDRRFVVRVEMALRAEEALAAHRRRIWRRFGVELAAGTAAAVGAALMVRQPALVALAIDQPWFAGLLFAAAPLAWAGTNRWRVTEA